MDLTPPLKWHGGKHYLAKRIIAMMPPHIHYVEPFAGGLAVLLAKDPEGVSEVVNDLNGQLVNFWRVLAAEPAFFRLRRMMEVMPVCEAAFDSALAHISRPCQEIVGICPACAQAFFVACRQSLAGRMKAFTGITKTRTRGGMNGEVSAWLSAVDGLPEVHARLRRVLILNRPALDVIAGQDGKDTLFYLDPPYYPCTRKSPDAYAHEMPVGDHWSLLGLLSQVKGKFLLSGYRNASYDSAAESHGWHRTDFDLANRAAGGAEKRRMTECVWTNFDPAKG